MKDDPYSFAVSFFSFFLGQQLGSVIGPYALVIICSMAGAMIALGRRDPARKPAGWAFIAVVVVAAFCGTWLVSMVVSQYVHWLSDPRTVFAPVAFAIGFIGLDWDEVIPYALNLYLRFRGFPPRENGNG
jgi:uncharacterized membrane protein AbrB (regulator of aidB expression)